MAGMTRPPTAEWMLLLPGAAANGIFRITATRYPVRYFGVFCGRRACSRRPACQAKLI